MAVFVLLLASALVFSLAAFSIDAAAAGELTVTGGTSGTDYTYSSGVLTIISNKELTISGTTTSDRIVVDSTSGANITLNGVEIDVSAMNNTAAFLK